MAIQITIIGLHRMGASIGLALKEHPDLLKRMGHDRDAAVARQAEKLGAVDQISFNLPASVRQADLVIITEPLDELQETLKIVGMEIHQGAVVMDTSPVKTEMAEIARKALPAERHYVSLWPALNPKYIDEIPGGPETAHADLFQNSLVLITQPYGTNAEAIKLASDLASLLGATPLFADMAEADGLIAATKLLPQLAAAALLNATLNEPGWRESRKVAGGDYARATGPVEVLPEAKALGQAMLMNRDNTLRVLDNLAASLHDLRQAIATQDQEALQNLLEGAREGRTAWLKQRQAGDWISEGAIQQRAPSAGEMLGRLVGLRRKPEARERRE